MRFADNSPDPQAQQGQTPVNVEATIDEVAGEMAGKALKHEKAHESDDVVGGVRSNSGGIFSK